MRMMKGTHHQDLLTEIKCWNFLMMRVYPIPSCFFSHCRTKFNYKLLQMTIKLLSQIMHSVSIKVESEFMKKDKKAKMARVH